MQLSSKKPDILLIPLTRRAPIRRCRTLSPSETERQELAASRRTFIKQHGLVYKKVALSILGIDERTLRRWKNENRGPQVFRIGKKDMYRRANIDAIKFDKKARKSRWTLNEASTWIPDR